MDAGGRRRATPARPAVNGHRDCGGPSPRRGRSGRAARDCAAEGWAGLGGEILAAAVWLGWAVRGSADRPATAGCLTDTAGQPVPCQNLHMGVEVVFLAVISLLCGTR